MSKKKPVEDDSSRLPPWSKEAEEGVIGCLIYSADTTIHECRERVHHLEMFHDPRLRDAFDCILKCYSDGGGLDFISFIELMKGRGYQADSVTYLASLPDLIPSAANLPTYLDHLDRYYHRRQLIAACVDASERMFESDDFETAFGHLRHRVLNISRQTESKSGESYKLDELAKLDVSRDASSLLGNRWLCRKGKLLISATSGAGKSSGAMQMAILWALSLDFCGIKPARPLKSVIFGDENDAGDLAEMVQGILSHLGITPDTDFEYDDKLKQLRENVVMIHCAALSGDRFLAFAERKILELKPDIAWIDPLVSFADVDLSKQEGAAKFLRQGLSRIADSTGVIWSVVHHTTKTSKDSKSKSGWKQSDHQYAGAGSYDLPGWARAVMTLNEAEDGLYRLILAKRGRRAGATHPDGEPTTTVWLRHAQKGIYWEHVQPPNEPDESDKVAHKAKGGKPSTVDKILKFGLGKVIDSLKEPVGKNDFAKLIRKFVSVEFGEVSLTTCKTVVDRLLDNKAVKYSDSGYEKP